MRSLPAILLLIVSVLNAGWCLLGGFPIGLDFQGGALLVFGIPTHSGPGRELDPRVQIDRALNATDLEGSVLRRRDQVRVEIEGPTEEDIRHFLALVTPPDLLLLPVLGDDSTSTEEGPDPERTKRLTHEEIAGGKRVIQALIVSENAIATGADVTRASVDRTHPMHPAVLVELNSEAGARFHQYTREHSGGRIAIVIDGAVVMAPVIRDAIPNGRILITLGGETDTEEASTLATKLSGGAGVPLKLREQQLIHSSAPSVLGRPLLSSLAVLAAILWAVALAVGMRRWAVGCAAGIGALSLGAGALLLFGGVLTTAVYAGVAPLALAAALAVAFTEPDTTWGSRLIVSWPGLGLLLVVWPACLIANPYTRGFWRGVSLTVSVGGLAIILLTLLSIAAVAPPTPPTAPRQ